VQGDFAVEVADPASQQVEGQRGQLPFGNRARLIGCAAAAGAGAGAGVGVGQAQAGVEQPGFGQPAQLVPQLGWGGDDQGADLGQRPLAGLDRGAAGDEGHPRRFPRSAGLGPTRMGPFFGQRLTGGADGVLGVGAFPAAARRPLGPLRLDDFLAGLAQRLGQARAVAAGSLDRPGPRSGHRGGPERDQRQQAALGGVKATGAQHPPHRGTRRRGVLFAVRVHPDHPVDPVGHR
jgi:hypothetical protein